MKFSNDFTKVFAWVLWIFGVLFLLRGEFVMEAGIYRTWLFGAALIVIGFYVNSKTEKVSKDAQKDETPHE